MLKSRIFTNRRAAFMQGLGPCKALNIMRKKEPHERSAVNAPTVTLFYIVDKYLLNKLSLLFPIKLLVAITGIKKKRSSVVLSKSYLIGSEFTSKLHNMQPFEADIFKLFRGSMPLAPPSKPTTPAILPTTQKHFDCIRVHTNIEK